jgi:hypothetical protein
LARGARTRIVSGAASTTSSTQSQSYVSRAHPGPVPEYPIGTALQMVLEGIEERKVKRTAKWERNAPVRQSKGVEVSNALYCDV